MSLPTERWLDLLDPKLEEERSEITEDLLEAEGREFVAEVRSKLDHALAVLAVEAQQEADMYWNAHKSAREEASEDEQGRVGTRVRILGVSLVAEWYRNRFVEQVPGQRKGFYRHISRRVAVMPTACRTSRKSLSGHKS